MNNLVAIIFFLAYIIFYAILTYVFLRLSHESPLYSLMHAVSWGATIVGIIIYGQFLIGLSRMRDALELLTNSISMISIIFIVMTIIYGSFLYFVRSEFIIRHWVAVSITHAFFPTLLILVALCFLKIRKNL